MEKKQLELKTIHKGLENLLHNNNNIIETHKQKERHVLTQRKIVSNIFKSTQIICTCSGKYKKSLKYAYFT